MRRSSRPRPRSAVERLRRARGQRGVVSGERGVTLVEYVLFVGGFVLVAVSAVGGLNTTARTYFQSSSSKIGSPVNQIVYDENGNRQQLASTTTITAPPATTTTAAPTTTSTTTTSTTTTSTATTPPTTTTASTTTSTTTTSTTTTTTPQGLATVLADYSDDDPANWNRWVAKVRVTLSSTGGASKSGKTVNATFTRSGGSSVTRSCVTNSSGVCYMEWNNRSYSTSYVDVLITSVTGGAPWTGSDDDKRLWSP